MAQTVKNKLNAAQQTALIQTLKARFENNKHRHETLDWEKIESKLNANAEKLWSLNEMEKTGGEPDVVFFDTKKNEFHFYDCSTETPKDRTSLCYDQAALIARKENRPKNSAIQLANAMNIELLNEEQYRYLQQLGNFDTKTSSWILTPNAIRKLGGAIFADFRYNHIFIYHNGAQSYYASRGFRGCLKL